MSIAKLAWLTSPAPGRYIEDPNKRAEREAILETYMQALGML
jgi:hypothetical protein